MRSKLQIAVIALGALFTLEGIGWLVFPTRAASGLGMPLLDGLGRSTQIGDFAVFFLALGLSILVGTGPRRARVLYAPAAVLGGAAAFRIVAWAVQGAAFATAFIVLEVVASGLLLALAAREQRYG
jgi:hypothetical protein